MANQQINEKKTSSKDGDDLTTVLDQSQRADLTLLIAGITESMRTSLLQTFDADAGLDKSFSRKGMTEDEKLMRSDLQSADVEEMDRQKGLREDYRRDLASMKMKTLKKYSLQAFDDWRDQVVVRIGEVVNNRDTAKKQMREGATADTKSNTPIAIGKAVDVLERGNNLKFKDLYPPTKSPLTKLSMEQRTLVLHSMLLLMLSLKHYNATSRVLLLFLTSSLKLPLKTFEQDEYATAKGLLEGVKEMTAEEETKKKVEENKESRKWKVGIATVAGAALIGVTGGLAAPLVAAGVGSVMGGIGLGATSAATYLGSVAGSTYLIGGLFGAYGGRMTGNMMDNYAKEVEDFEFLPIHTDKKTSEETKIAAKQASEHDHKLRVTICISGWLTEKDEILKPWRVLGTGAEVFALKYELEAMLNLGNAMNGFVQSAAWGYAKKQVIAQTIFADLAAAMWPIGLLKAARVIDNPFNIAKSRSEKAGEVLADALINKAQGERPVTLIGYSLGARVIYCCLTALAKRKAFGLVENAVLVGAPTPSDTSDWRLLRTVVSGRLVNVYSENDYVLGFMYRTSSLQYGVAGLQGVEGLPSVENVDVSDEVSGHLRYRYLMGSILKKIGFEDVNMDAVEQEKQALAKMEEEEKQKSLQAQHKRLVRRESNGGQEDEEAEADREASEIETEVQNKTQKSMLTKAMQYFYAPKPPNKETAEKPVERAAKQSPEFGEAAFDTAKETQSSNPSMAQRAYAVLPSMPHLPRGSPEATSKDVSPKEAADSTPINQSYGSKASSYLPSMPKSLPSIPKSLSSIPGLPGRNKEETADDFKPTRASESSTKTKVGQHQVKNRGDTADEVVRPMVKTKNDTKGNSAVQTAHDTTRRVSDTRGTGTPGTDDIKNLKPGADRSAQKITAAMSKDGIRPAMTANPTSKVDTPQTKSSNKAQDSNQSYTAYAASYLPSLPKSMPSVPGWSSGRKAASKLDREGSSATKPPPPKLERRGSSHIKSTTTVSNQRTEPRPKSRPAKLGPRRTNSEAKS